MCARYQAWSYAHRSQASNSIRRLQQAGAEGASFRARDRSYDWRDIVQARQDVGEAGLRIDFVKFAVSVSPPSSEPAPVVATDRNAAQCPLRSVVRNAQPAIVEEACGRRPKVKTVIDGLGSLALG